MRGEPRSPPSCFGVPRVRRREAPPWVPEDFEPVRRSVQKDHAAFCRLSKPRRMVRLNSGLCQPSEGKIPTQKGDVRVNYGGEAPLRPAARAPGGERRPPGGGGR